MISRELPARELPIEQRRTGGAADSPVSAGGAVAGGNGATGCVVDGSTMKGVFPGESTDRSSSDQTGSRRLVPCIHCGEPTSVRGNAQDEPVFCCTGCRGAYELIHGWGLDQYYALRDQLPDVGHALAAGSQRVYEQFNSPEFLGESAPVELTDGLQRSDLAIHGLHCGACAWLIENAAVRYSGLLSARVKMSDHTIRLVFDPQATDLARIAEFFDRLGYQLAPLDRRRDDHIQVESRRLLIQIAIAGFLAANAMWIAIALYAGEFTGVADEHRYFLGMVGTVLGVLSVVGPGRTFFVGALAALKTWTPHMDMPIALGLSVGTVVGLYNAVLGQGHIYFDSLATLVFLLLIGRWIQFRQQQRAARAVDLMLRITPRHALQIDAAGSKRTVLVDRLQAGDVIRVSAGESIAADGEVLTGSSALDLSLLTGESRPVEVTEGDVVSAGTVNLTAPIDIRVAATGQDSRIGRVMQSVEAALAEKSPIVQLADRIGGVFVVSVTLLAIVTFAVWFSSGLGTATANATALLIVACPCALALATPLAIAVSLGRAAKQHILVRTGQSLQLLATPGILWLDKTGTLTEGRQRVNTVLGDPRGLQLAASVEQGCVHPVAAAIVREATERLGAERGDEGEANLESLAAEVVEVVQGGVAGTVDEQQIEVGNQQFIASRNIHVPDWAVEQADRLAGDGESPVFIAVNRAVVTLLGLSDPLRSGAVSTVKRLQRLGWQIGILSGDHPDIVRKVADHLGLVGKDCHGGMLPEEKLATIRRSRLSGVTTVMVGDGANDAAALAAADVGIAVRGGAEVSLQAAPIFVASGKIASLVTLMLGAKRAQRLICINFAVSLSYNVIAVGLAVAGLISPLAAAILMPISSISVLALTLSVPTFSAEQVYRSRSKVREFSPA